MATCCHIRRGNLELELGCDPCDERQYHLDRLTSSLSDSIRPEREGLLEPRAAIFYEQTGSVSIVPHPEELGPWLSSQLADKDWSIYATPGWERSQGIELQIDVGATPIVVETIPVKWTGGLNQDTILWRDTILSNWPRIMRALKGPSILSTSNEKGSRYLINTGQPNRMSQRSIRDVKR